MHKRQTVRQRVQKALSHKQPESVPFSWGLYPTPEMTSVLDAYLRQQGMSWRGLFLATEDSLRISPRYIGPPLAADTDMWGITHQPIQYGNGNSGGSYDEIAVYPLLGLRTVEEINAYAWPSPDWFDYDRLRDDLETTDPYGRLAGKLWIDVCGNPLEIYTWMTGHEETFTNLALYPQVVHAAMEHITRFFEAKLRRTLQLVADRVDICYFADDLGGQNGLLISPEMYRQMTKPYHQRLFRLAKALAPHAAVMLHTDGSVFDLLPDLIEAGVEVLEAVQVDAAKMDPQALKAHFGDRLAFHGGISVQALLPKSTASQVEAACQQLVADFNQSGGYIAAPTHSIQVGTPPENVMAMLRGVLGAERYAVALQQARLEAFVQPMTADHPYLYLPVKAGAEKVIFQVKQAGKMVREFDIELALNESPDWWAFYDIRQFKGAQIQLVTPKACLPAIAFAWLSQAISQGEGLKGADDLFQERYRPQFHFTPQRGWNNDPNGLVFQDGTWHMFYQHNPFGTGWGNMHWGHAASRDLVHWQELPLALYARSLEDMAFSGGGVIDAGNTSGFAQSRVEPMVLSFTSTGRGECLAYSLDSGHSFQEYPGNPVIRHQGRDPKIIWYAPGNKWVMIVYEELPGERGYALYDSPDLISWRRMSFLPGFYECPELFEMPVEGSPGESYWVVYGCRWEKDRSVFQVGNFDGDTFTPLTETIQAHYGPHFYAAQTFSNQPDGRRLMIGWLAGASYPDMPFSQGMTIPLELSLKRFSTGLRLCFYPASEVEALRVSTHSAEALTFEQVQSLLDTLQGELFDITLEVSALNQGSLNLEIGNQRLAFDPVSGEVSFAGSQVKLPEGTTSIEIRLLVDRSVTEVFVNQGWAAFSAMTLFPSGPRRFKLSSEGHVQLVIIHLLRSIWE